MKTKLKYINLFEEHKLDSINIEDFRVDILKNWEDYYESSHGVEIPYNRYGIQNIMGEVWTTECILDFFDENDIDYEDFDDEDVESYLYTAIDSVIEEEKWDGYIYIEPDESGEEFGITIFFRYQ